MNRVPTSAIFFEVCPNFHLQLWIDCGYSPNRHTGQAQHGFSQVRRRSHDGTALVNQPLYSFIKVKATLATWAVCQMCLHHCNFLIAEFPVDIEMETGNRFKTIHIETFFH